MPEDDRFDLIYCTQCLTPNTRPNGEFNADGVCEPCRFAVASSAVDYRERQAELLDIIHPLLRTSSSSWDCIVGVSGGKDSTRQALWTRDVLGLHPLLVSVGYPDAQLTSRGAENLANLISLGFDCLLVKPGPRLSRLLVREAFLRFANWARATEMSLFASVQQVAVQRDINLVLWGENPALQVGDQGTLGTSIWDGSSLRHGNTLGAGDLTWFQSVAHDPRSLAMYRFPSQKVLDDGGVRTVFLGPAWPDWSNNANTAVALANGFQLREALDRECGDAFGSSMVDEDWFIVNNLVKYFKFGFSRGTEQANTLIREGKISREAGVHVANRFDSSCDERYIHDFCEYTGLSSSDFWSTIRHFANPWLFDTRLTGPPRARFTPGTNQVFTLEGL